MDIIKSLILSFLLVCILFSCRSQNGKEDSYKNFPIAVTDEYKNAESYILKHMPELGAFYVYHLKTPKIIQTYPCTGKFTINNKGEISSFTLSEDHMINGILILAKSHYSAIYSLEGNQLDGCPACESTKVKVKAGKEFRLESIEIEN